VPVLPTRLSPAVSNPGLIAPLCPVKPSSLRHQILETKVRKLEQLVRLKDAKIQTLTAKIQAGGLAI
jgi:hypothetical protein